MQEIARIGMWSGPRNISTAMMRSWENRDDTIVVDEPLYGSYLFKTKKQHPMHAAIIQHQGKEVHPIINHLVKGKLPARKSIYYQKHMCHHILDDQEISWIKYLKNVFLIRDPRSVLSSYLKKHDTPTANDLGYPQQLRLFNYIKQQYDDTPIVLDSKDILQSPTKMMTLLCTKLGIEFDEKMMAWPKGYRNTDGIWAPHWYNRVIESSGFTKFNPKEINLNTKEKSIANECMPYYLELSKYKVTAVQS